MRCINMKIIGVLIFLINLMTIKSNSIPPRDKTSHALDKGNLNTFERNCPEFWSVIKSHNLTEWTNCEYQLDTVEEATIEKVLQFTSFLAKTMMLFICNNKLDMPNDYLGLPQTGSLCPFEFPENLHLFQNISSKLFGELTNETQCSKVCYDLHKRRSQCEVLEKFNNYLKSVAKQSSRIGIVLPDERKSEISTPMPKSTVVGDSSADQKARKETTIKSKTETKSNKDATSPVKSQIDETKISDLTNLEHKLPGVKTPDLKVPEPKNTEKKNLDVESSVNFSSKKLEVSEASKTKIEIPRPEIKEATNFNEEPPVDDINGIGDDNAQDSLLSDLNEPEIVEKSTLGEQIQDVQIPFQQQEITSNNGFLQPEDSHFFFYFIVVSSIVVIGYIGFHNKNKILAYALEGTSGRRSRRRPNPARYRKLETNLEEAISSNASETIASSVVY